MKKHVSVFAVMAALLLGLTGCMSPMAKSIEKNRIYYAVTALDSADVLSEEEGFHYPGMSWDMTLSEIKDINYSSISGYLAYSDEGDYTYEMNGMFSSVAGRSADSVAISVNAQGQVYMISATFTTDGEGTSTPKNQEVFDRGLANLQELFGEADDYQEEVHEVVSSSVTVPTTTMTYTWNRVDADGVNTQLQLVCAYVSYSDTPSYVMLGLMRVNGNE